MGSRVTALYVHPLKVTPRHYSPLHFVQDGSHSSHSHSHDSDRHTHSNAHRHLLVTLIRLRLHRLAERDCVKNHTGAEVQQLAEYKKLGANEGPAFSLLLLLIYGLTSGSQKWYRPAFSYLFAFLL